MSNEKILVIGGSFDEIGGKPSSFIDKFFSKIEGAMIINGGLFDFLKNFIEEGISDYKIIFWLPEYSEEVESLSNIKALNSKCILIRDLKNTQNISDIDIAKELLTKKANLMLKISEESEKISAITISSEKLFEMELSENNNFVSKIIETKTLKEIMEKSPYKEPEKPIEIERLHLRIIEDTIDILYRPNHNYIAFVPNDDNGKAEVKRIAQMSREEFCEYLKTRPCLPKLTKEDVLNLKNTKAEEWFLGAWKMQTDNLLKELCVENPIEEPIWKA